MWGFIIVVVASVIWLITLVRMDSNRRYKRLAEEVVVFFFLSFAFGFVTYFLEIWVNSAIFFISAYSWILYDFFSCMFVGFVEEGIKFAILFIVLSGRRKIWEPRDIMIFAGASALGFASMENVWYNFFVSARIIGIRSFITVGGHIAYSFIWAVGLIIYLFGFYEKKTAKQLLLLFYLAAVFAHGFCDFLLDMDTIPVIFAFLWDVIAVIGAAMLFNLVTKESPYKKFSFNEADTAIEKIEKSLLLNKSNYILNRKVARFYIYKGRFRDALRALNICLKQQPKNLYLHFYIALVEFIMDPEDDKRFQQLLKVASAIESVDYRKLDRLKDSVIFLLKESPGVSEKIVDRIVLLFSQFDPRSIMYGLYMVPKA